MGDNGILSIEVNTADFYRAQQAIAMVNDKGTYRGMFRDEISDDLIALVAYAGAITHRSAGGHFPHLADAHTWEYDSHRMKGRMFINPGSEWIQGAVTVRRPHIYGVYEHRRGGSHAFYERTYREYAVNLLPKGLHAAVRGLPWP